MKCYVIYVNLKKTHASPSRISPYEVTIHSQYQQTSQFLWKPKLLHSNEQTLVPILSHTIPIHTFKWIPTVISPYLHLKSFQWFVCVCVLFNPLMPNDPYMGHTARLTSKRFILYTVIPRLTKIIRSGITFVSRNVISHQPRSPLCDVISSFLCHTHTDGKDKLLEWPDRSCLLLYVSARIH